VSDIVAAPQAGRILDETTPQCIASAVAEILSAPPDRDRTRRYAEGFSWDSTTSGQIELFRQICNRPTA
jgi:teichuronic acid biosynthesis glycosyltransferase TuaC